MLPRVSGFDVLHHIRTDSSLRTIPRIVITGASQREAIVADAIFEKPFDHAELVATIHRLVGATDVKNVAPGADRRSHRDIARDAVRTARH
jgi:CheY-like chemotaxis protein